MKNKEKNKQIMKDSVDAILSGITGVSVAWGICKAFFGAGLKLRQNRVIEWAEMIKNNPGIFVNEVTETEEFQDGFVYILEKYIRERNDRKRKHIQSVFMNFTTSKNKIDFELEKLMYTLSQITEQDIECLKYVSVKSISSYQIFDDQKFLSNIYNLINLGILYVDPTPRVGPIESPFVYTSNFGRRFIQYIKYEK